MTADGKIRAVTVSMNAFRPLTMHPIFAEGTATRALHQQPTRLSFRVQRSVQNCSHCTGIRSCCRRSISPCVFRLRPHPNSIRQASTWSARRSATPNWSRTARPTNRAASKTRSKENRRRDGALRSLRSSTSRLVGESVQFCSDIPRSHLSYALHSGTCADARCHRHPRRMMFTPS